MKRPEVRSAMLLLLAGGCFLWEPNIGVIDPLPDLIGYLLLFLGSIKLSDLNDTLLEAQRGFRAMLWVGFARVAAQLFVKLLLDQSEVTLNRYEQPVWVLLLSFSFLVLEWYWMLPAWKHFFKGLSDLSEFHGGRNLLVERRGKTLCQCMTRFTRMALIVRTLLTVLPEATILTSFEKDAENPLFTFDWYQYINAFRAVAVILALVVGAAWLVRWIGFWRAALKDLPWIEGLSLRYRREILPNVGLLMNRRVSAAFSFWRIGALFAANLAIAHRDMLPDWASVFLFFFGGIVLGRLIEDPKPSVICGGALLAVSGARTVLLSAYLQNYVPQDAWYLPRAYEQYLPIRVLGWMEAILSALLICCLVKALFRMAMLHTSVDYGDGTRLLSQGATERMHGELRRQAVPVCLVVAVAAICKILEIELQISFGWFWLLQFAVSVVAAVAFSAFLSNLAEKLADRYPIQKSV
ncbi:MAG: hypothetical protein E7620_03030 [Ruminococcaceae bacterium]|nr:hypothetical protein [Oscillospiraceae bacterium]